MSEPRDLALIDRACAALAEASTVEEAKEIRDVASAAQHYASKRKGAESAERYANEIRLRAERKIGELTRAMEKATAGRKPSVSNARPGGEDSEPTKADTLKRVGIATEDASRFERMAAVPSATFEREVVKPEATTRGLARLAPVKARRERVKVAAPSVDQRIVTQRVRAFRSDLDRLIRKHTSRWPENAPVSALANVLTEASESILREGK